MKYFSLTAIVLAATIVKAQTPDACIIGCATASCPNGLTDLNCFCVTGTAAIAACIGQNCTAADLTTAQALGASVCGALGNSTVSASAPAASSNATTTSAALASASGTPSPVVTTSAPASPPSGSTTGTPASAATSSASSSSNIMIGNGGLAGVLALAVAIAVAVGVVA